MKILILFLVFTATTFWLQAKNDTIYRNISIIQGDSLIQANTDNSNFIIIDVRQATPFATSHIANSINIDYYDPNFSSLLDTLNHSNKYLIYCQGGTRSSATLALMQNKHFKEVYNMLGGITAWINAGYPTVSGTTIAENNALHFSSFVYPNPISENSVIQINNYYSTSAQIEIFEISGKKIYAIPVLTDNSSLSEYLFEKGVYFYLITSENKILTSGKFDVIR